MKEIFIIYAKSIFIVLPIFLLTIRLIFKKSILTRIGYIIVVTVVLATIISSTLEIYKIPMIVGVVMRILIIIGAIFLLKKEISLLHNLNERLVEIANFNISETIDERYLKRKDEFGLLAQSLNKMEFELKNIVELIKENSDQLASTSTQLSSTSDQISSGVSEQAATTEQISSSIEEMIASIESNNITASKTNSIASKSAKDIEEAFEIFKETLNSVNNISEKITIITAISQETNLLSLNASIEAARAGSAGRGFAIVAQEVRKLADNSRTASTDISEITHSSQELSNYANEQFQKIIPDILKSADLVNKIATANSEQLSGTGLINTSVQQLASITNQNSVASEEMAATAEELASQAKDLKNIVSVFKLK